jgi:hypothetical protein
MSAIGFSQPAAAEVNKPRKEKKKGVVQEIQENSKEASSSSEFKGGTEACLHAAISHWWQGVQQSSWSSATRRCCSTAVWL